MSVYGVGNYRDTLYQWQAQQLKSTGSSSSSSNSAASSLFGNTSMIDQVSSMIELTKYAMDAMGVSGDARVTFSQITKYRNQLESEFNQSVKAGLTNSGIKDISALSFSLDKNGVVSAIGLNAQDRSQAQAWLDANPGFGQELRKSLDEAGLTDKIAFGISSTGKMNVINNKTISLQDALDQNPDLTTGLRSGLEKLGISLKGPLEMSFSEDGQLVATGENAEAINQWLKDNPELETELKKQLDKYDIATSAVSLRLNQTGNIQANVNSQQINDIQAVLDKAADSGKKLYAGLSSRGIDPNIKFSIKIEADGSFNVISDHPDRDKVQKFFEDNPELIKKYRQIETLSGIDDARKAMQLSPSTMRKRIQIESMAAWWAGSSDASSYFGNYSNGEMSLLSGLNLRV